MAEKRVIIEHKDGRRYGIAPSDFDKLKVEGDQSYKDLGFKIVGHEDGEPYSPPEKPKAAAQSAGKD